MGRAQAQLASWVSRTFFYLGPKSDWKACWQWDCRQLQLKPDRQSMLPSSRNRAITTNKLGKITNYIHCSLKKFREIFGLMYKKNYHYNTKILFTNSCGETCYPVNVSTWFGPIELVQPIYGVILPILILITLVSNSLIILVLSR